MKTSAKNKPLLYECPVCGYGEMTDAPEAGEICSCCGTQFDSEGYDRSPHELRISWIDRDMPWFSRGRKQPKNWNPYRQLIIAKHGPDLLLHPRMDTDFEFRYAVDEAFSTVFIGAQLKLLRETRKVPLTQKELADKTGMKQSRISELEAMDYSSHSVTTLWRFARALGIRLMFRFEAWGELVPEMASGLSREALWVPSFEEDVAFQKRAEILCARADRIERAARRTNAASAASPAEVEAVNQEVPAKVLPFRAPRGGALQVESVEARSPQGEQSPRRKNG